MYRTHLHTYPLTHYDPRVTFEHRSDIKMKRGGKPKGIAAANKKRKEEKQAEALVSSPFTDALLAAPTVALASAAFATARPVKHVVLESVCKEDRLKAVFQQALHGLSADLRESDTSKLYQGTELAALDAEKAELVQVCKLRDALYSAEMREIVAAIVKCGDLADTVDCVATIYNEGCHLLPHALLPHDGRRVAFFLFLTPDEEWCEADGATLDLYDVSATSDQTAAAPARSILPNWNSMVLVDVDEGTAPVVGLSEVFSEDKTLMCFGGWYHLLEPSKARGAGEKADGAEQDDVEYRAVTASAALLSDADKKELGTYIAEQYLQDDIIAKICKDFEDDSAAQLRKFLLPRSPTALLYLLAFYCLSFFVLT